MDAVLPGVTSLALLAGGGDRTVQAAISRLAAAFPRLNECTFMGDFPAEGDIDVAPLAGLSQLQYVAVSVGRERIRNAELLRWPWN